MLYNKAIKVRVPTKSDYLQFCIIKKLRGSWITSWTVFQRVSVIVSDAVLCYACSQATSIATNDQLAKPLLTLLYMFNAGLLIVDHVHFQYNG